MKELYFLKYKINILIFIYKVFFNFKLILYLIFIILLINQFFLVYIFLFISLFFKIIIKILKKILKKIFIIYNRLVNNKPFYKKNFLIIFLLLY